MPYNRLPLIIVLLVVGLGLTLLKKKFGKSPLYNFILLGGIVVILIIGVFVFGRR